MSNKRVITLAVLALLAAGMRLWASKPAPGLIGYTKQCMIRTIGDPGKPPKNYSYDFYNAPIGSGKFVGAPTCYVTLAPATKAQVISALKKYKSDMHMMDKTLNNEKNTLVRAIIEDLRHIKKLTVGKAIWLLEQGPKKDISSLPIKPMVRTR